MKTLNDIINAVSYINEQFLSQTTEYYTLTVVTDGEHILVKFLGNTLWSSVDDDRWSDGDNVDPFIPHLLNEVQAEIGKLTAIQFYQNEEDISTWDNEVLYNM